MASNTRIRYFLLKGNLAEQFMVHTKALDEWRDSIRVLIRRFGAAEANVREGGGGQRVSSLVFDKGEQPKGWVKAQGDRGNAYRPGRRGKEAKALAEEFDNLATSPEDDEAMRYLREHGIDGPGFGYMIGPDPTGMGVVMYKPVVHDLSSYEQGVYLRLPYREHKEGEGEDKESGEIVIKDPENVIEVKNWEYQKALDDAQEWCDRKNAEEAKAS